MEVSMQRGPVNAVLAIIAALALSSCGEKSPRPDPEGDRGHSNETPQHPVYERTVKQGESERIGN
jgi:hypothetical protein